MLHLSATFLDPMLKLFTFVRSTADREDFLVQVKESLIILAKETDQNIESLYISTEDVDVTRTNHDFDHSILDMQPQKKAKYHPFTWFQTDNSTTLSTTNKITNIDSLVKYSCISKKWFQNERISTYLTGGIIINFNTHYCRRLPCNYWSFRHPHQRARGILVPLMLYI